VAVKVTVHAVWTSVTGWAQVPSALTSIPVVSGVMWAPQSLFWYENQNCLAHHSNST